MTYIYLNLYIRKLTYKNNFIQLLLPLFRLKMLNKQVEDGQELRKQLTESVNDLQRQLKNEREENKKSKKRYVDEVKQELFNYRNCVIL